MSLWALMLLADNDTTVSLIRTQLSTDSGFMPTHSRLTLQGNIFLMHYVDMDLSS